MKVKKDYIIKTIGEEIVILPINDQAVKFNGIISVNKVGAYLFELLQVKDLTKNDLVKFVLDKYEIDEKTVKNDVEVFVEKCKIHNLIK